MARWSVSNNAFQKRSLHGKDLICTISEVMKLQLVSHRLRKQPPADPLLSSGRAVRARALKRNVHEAQDHDRVRRELPAVAASAATSDPTLRLLGLRASAEGCGGFRAWRAPCVEGRQLKKLFMKGALLLSAVALLLWAHCGHF